jgi:hypothetical protein
LFGFGGKAQDALFTAEQGRGWGESSALICLRMRRSKAVHGLRQRQAAEEAGTNAQALQEPRAEPLEEPMSPVEDNPEAEVTAIEFFDSNGPHAAARRRQ